MKNKGEYDFDRRYTPGFEGDLIIHLNPVSPVFTEDFKDWMFSYQRGCCGYCGNSLGQTWRGNRNAHIEHVCNRRNGGCDTPPNLVYACRSCNIIKARYHYTVLKIKIPMRNAGISGFISHTKCMRLINMGLMNIKPLDELHFEKEKWAHVDGDYYEPSERDIDLGLIKIKANEGKE